MLTQAEIMRAAPREKQYKLFDGNGLAPLVILSLSSTTQDETVDVKYHGRVDLEPFVCADTVSSFVNRVCYDKKETYVLILLNKTWYHYCEIPERVVRDEHTDDSTAA